MTPSDAQQFLSRIIESGEQTPVCLMGPPGIGKSDIVQQTADQHGMDLIDLRLAQVPPADIRGLPQIVEGISRYARPAYLPKDGVGILFLDEITNAPPAVQGLVQQLVLDRMLGEHRIGDGWRFVLAGNRREHGAAVHGMPAPVANRMIHLEVEADFDSWKRYALAHEIHPDVVGFLTFRPELMFRLDRKSLAFPSPRSWCVASRLHALDLPIDPAVGEGCAQEFGVYCAIVQDLPDLSAILAGHGDTIVFPREMSAKYAVTVGLAMRCQTEHDALAAFQWINQSAGAEWVQMFVGDCLVRLEQRGKSGQFAAMVATEPALSGFVENVLAAVFE